MRKGIMIDTETLGMSDRSVVVQIHLAAFDLDDPESTVNHFGSTLPLDPQIRAGRTVDADTLVWWLSQEDDARVIFASEETKGNRDDLYNFLQAAMTWLGHIVAASDETQVWGMGAGFDTRVIKNLVRDFELDWPVHYRGERDLRTLLAESGIVKESVPLVTGYVKHNARFDCLQQIRWYFAAERSLGQTVGDGSPHGLVVSS